MTKGKGPGEIGGKSPSSKRSGTSNLLLEGGMCGKKKGGESIHRQVKEDTDLQNSGHILCKGILMGRFSTALHKNACFPSPK